MCGVYSSSVLFVLVVVACILPLSYSSRGDGEEGFRLCLGMCMHTGCGTYHISEKLQSPLSCSSVCNNPASPGFFLKFFRWGCEVGYLLAGASFGHLRCSYKHLTSARLAQAALCMRTRMSSFTYSDTSLGMEKLVRLICC